MDGLLYLLSRRLKNQLREFVKTPSKLFLALFLIVFVGFSVFQGIINQSQAEARDISELYAMCFALYTLIFIMVSYKGFSGGATMFSMADVNLAFTAPFSCRRVLSYGLVQQLGQSLLLGLFILYQFGWLNDSYGIGLGTLVIILVGYSLTVFLGRLAAMVLYMFTASDTKRRGIVKTVYYAVPVGYAVYAFINVYPQQDNMLGALVKLANGTAFGCFPVSGWTSAAVKNISEGNWLYAVLAVAGAIAFIGLCYALISLTNSDYYEDVLQATETSFSAITAKKEGKVVETGRANVRVGRTGINGGSGASTFYFKHMLENRRGSYFYLSLPSVIVAAVTVVLAVLMKDNIFVALCTNIYLLVFFVGFGRWARELTLPYAYLIPEPAFKKLLFCLMEFVPKLLLEGVVTFVPIAFIVKLTVSQTIGLILARTGFGLLFTGVNLLMERVFGSTGKKTLVVIAYCLSCALCAVPSIAVGSVIYQFAGCDYFSFWVTGGCTAVNILVFAVLLFISRNILECAELNNK